MTETLADLLADNFIRLKRVAPGANEHIRCPKCEGGKTGEVSFSVTIDPDGQGYTAFCHRGSCGFTEGKRLNGKAPERAQRPPRKVFQPAKDGYVADWFWNWFEQRGISGGTVEAFSCYVADHFFPDMGAKHQAVVIPFTWRGEITNRKYRAEPGKKGMAQEKDATPTLFNIDRALETGNGTLIWVEGELDVMALYECGIPNAVSLKDGAGKIGEKSGKRYEALTTHQEELAGIKRFILAGDMDEPGRAQVEELARRLGKQRCSVVEWPEGCKDANDTLLRAGPQAVQDAIEAAEPYPIEGLYRITAKALQNLADAPPPPTMTTGCGATDAILRLPTEGRLIVITGFPNHGKALALDTPVPTPTGWTTMGELKDGDTLYAPDGSITHVVKAHPVMVDRQCYRVMLRDGEEIIADAGHEWVTSCRQARMSEANAARTRRPDGSLRLRGNDQSHLRVMPSAKTTSEIAATLNAERGTRFNHSISVAEPLTGGMDWELSIPPYTLGAWLGDGHSASGNFTSADVEIIHEIRRDGLTVTKHPGTPYGWTITGLIGKLRKCGLLNNKHIPAACLRASLADRLALLQGLMDTDGYCSSRGEAEFCTTRVMLAEQVQELVISLGFRAVLRVGRATLNGKDCGRKYRVMFRPALRAFRLERKASKQMAPRSEEMRRLIIAVDPVASVPVRCITR